MKDNRTPKIAAGVALIMCAVPGTPALAADAHVHGRAALQVAVDGNRLLLELTSPLDNLMGFEHRPRNEKQIAEVRRMAERLHQPALLFVPSPEAGCTPAAVELRSDVLEPALLAQNAQARPTSESASSQAAKGKGKGKKDEHASLSAEIAFNCGRPEKLSSLEATIFDAFPNLRRIDVQVAGARKQAAARLTPRSRRIAW